MKKILQTSPYVIGFLILLSAGAVINARSIDGTSTMEQTLATSNGGIKAYPNPCDQVLNIKLAPNVTARQVLVEFTPSAGGSSIYRELVDYRGTPMAINTANIPNGLYNVQARTNDGHPTIFGNAQVQCTH